MEQFHGSLEAFGHRTSNAVCQRAKRFGLDPHDIFTNGAHVSSMVTNGARSMVQEAWCRPHGHGAGRMVRRASS
jgi:hypothetical protein